VAIHVLFFNSTIVLGLHENSITNMLYNIKVNQQDTENVEQFTYFGSALTEDGNVETIE